MIQGLAVLSTPSAASAASTAPFGEPERLAFTNAADFDGELRKEGRAGRRSLQRHVKNPHDAIVVFQLKSKLVAERRRWRPAGDLDLDIPDRQGQRHSPSVLAVAATGSSASSASRSRSASARFSDPRLGSPA